jgi:hypothetical protein
MGSRRTDVVGAFVWPASAILLALYKDGVAIRWADVLCRVRCRNRPGCGCAGLVVNIPRRAVGVVNAESVPESASR